MASRLLTSGTAQRIAIRCWGDFAIEDREGGADVRPRGRKARALLAYLTLHPGKPVSREKLMGLLWGERGEDQARGSLRQALFELRHLANGIGLLRVDRETVSLDPGIAVTDLDRMRQASKAGDWEALLQLLPDPDETLLANLDGVDPGFDEWLQIERTRQRDALTALLADASAGALASGHTRAARALHARLLEFDPGENVPAPPAPAPVVPNEVSGGRLKRRWMPVAAAVLAATGLAGGAAWFRSEPAAEIRLNPEAQQLYETAHDIIYRRRGAEFPTAIKLLRRAVMLEPGYVPAIADLAAVLGMNSPTPETRAEAEALARRAIQLDPRSAMAHGVLGMVLGFDSPEARAEVKKAAALDSRDPQIQFWLSNVLGLEGDYAGRLQALRRAVATDPLWHRASGMAALAAWEMGFPKEADAYATRLRETDLSRSFDCAYAIDWARGNYADVARDTLAVRARLDESNAADWKLGIALLVLGHREPARLLLRLPPPLWRVASGEGPAPGELEPLLIEANRGERAMFFALTALRQVLQAGRASEIVAAYDRKIGDLGRLASDDVPNETIITEGLQVALALRAVGRVREADALLARADRAIRRSYGYGAVPNWLPAAAAGVWAAQGRKEEALAALKTALDRGWHYSPMTPLPDMDDIPSFGSLRGDARFERLRQRELDHIARERRELGAVPV